ncbi:MAG: hypothetical protein HY940_04095 [Gammaproteobacteria bacterium]|nr:hypothetical protein [Gammaproteobacteria bacterium]
MNVRPLPELKPEQLASLLTASLTALYPSASVLGADLPLPAPHLLLQATDRLRLACYCQRMTATFLSDALQAFDELHDHRSWLRLLRPGQSIPDTLPLTLVLITPDPPPGLRLLEQCRPALELYRFRPLQIDEQATLILEPLFAATPLAPATPPPPVASPVSRHTPAELTAAEASFFNAINL